MVAAPEIAACPTTAPELAAHGDGGGKARATPGSMATVAELTHTWRHGGGARGQRSTLSWPLSRQPFLERKGRRRLKKKTRSFSSFHIKKK